jgi:hypothetical protein
VNIDSDSSLEQVAAAVAAAFEAAGLRAVLTGGAAAVIHTGGEYQSEDLDFILESSPSQERLDEVLSEIGFSRKRDHYVHPTSPFFIEFPRGPLSIGRDIRIRPVEARIGRQRILALVRRLDRYQRCDDGKAGSSPNCHAQIEWLNHSIGWYNHSSYGYPV